MVYLLGKKVSIFKVGIGMPCFPFNWRNKIQDGYSEIRENIFSSMFFVTQKGRQEKFHFVTANPLPDTHTL